MKPNGQIPYVNSNGTLTIAGMRLLANNGRVILPVLTATQRADYDPQQGEMIFNSTTGKADIWTGSAWEQVTSA